MSRTVVSKAVPIIVLLSVFGFSARVRGDCTYLADFSSGCSSGNSCYANAPYGPVYIEQWCEPWVTESFIKYAAFERQYDCAGNSCPCQPTCFPIDLCAYDTMAECQERHHGISIFCEDEYYHACAPDGGGFPPPDCPPEVCCIGGGGPGGGGPGSGGGGFMLALLKLLAHSPAPQLAIHYNNKLQLDRGMGKGWSS